VRLAVTGVGIAGGWVVFHYFFFTIAATSSFFSNRRHANDASGFYRRHPDVHVPYYHWRWEQPIHHSSSARLGPPAARRCCGLDVQEVSVIVALEKFAYRLARLIAIVLFCHRAVVLFTIRQRFHRSHERTAGNGIRFMQ